MLSFITKHNKKPHCEPEQFFKDRNGITQTATQTVKRPDHQRPPRRFRLIQICQYLLDAGALQIAAGPEFVRLDQEFSLRIAPLARNPATGHYRRHYGRLLRKGYRYVVSIRRKGRPLRQIPCKTEAEAVRYAHETYRGLARAAWGLSFAQLTGKLPPAFRRLMSERPRLASMSALNRLKFDQGKHEVTNTNMAVKTGDSYLSTLDVNASIAAVRTMNDRMAKFFKKKYNL